MSFAEFTYPLLQAWDWKHMFSIQKAQVQIGGSDQYGNIIGGIDAIRYASQANTELAWALTPDGKLDPAQAPMGITTPLLTTSSGEKFGKSAGNAVWLDKSLTSPFDLYGVSRISSTGSYLLHRALTNRRLCDLVPLVHPRCRRGKAS
jgi:tyrosyl-tRNA synthetase